MEPRPALAEDRVPKEEEALYAEGVRQFNLGEYDAAIDAFKRAYLISNEPSLLFNIAQAYRKQGAVGCGPALESYRSYLRQKPDAHDRAEVEATIDELDPCPASPPPVMPPVVVVAAPVREQPAGPTGAQLALGIGGASMLVAGGITFGITAAHYNTLQGDCPCPRERWTAWRNAEYTSYVALGLGAASVGTAVIWWITQRGSEGSSSSGVQLVPSTNGASVIGSF